MVGGQARSKGLPTDLGTWPAGVRSPLGAVTVVPPGGWSLVDNKTEHTHILERKRVLFNFAHQIIHKDPSSRPGREEGNEIRSMRAAVAAAALCGLMMACIVGQVSGAELGTCCREQFFWEGGHLC